MKINTCYREDYYVRNNFFLYADKYHINWYTGMESFQKICSLKGVLKMLRSKGNDGLFKGFFYRVNFYMTACMICGGGDCEACNSSRKEKRPMVVKINDKKIKATIQDARITINSVCPKCKEPNSFVASTSNGFIPTCSCPECHNSYDVLAHAVSADFFKPKLNTSDIIIIKQWYLILEQWVGSLTKTATFLKRYW